MSFGGGSGVWDAGPAFIRGADWNFRGNAWSNSAVMACMAWFMDTLPEAPPRIVKDVAGEVVVQEKHLLNQMFEQPHAYLSWGDMIGALGMSLALDGNGYFRRTFGSYSQPKLTWIPPMYIEPKERKGVDGIGYYEVVRRDGTREEVDPLEIIHFRQGIDPENTMKGLSRAKSIMREIMTDTEASQYNYSILKNMGIMGFWISPSKDDEFNPNAREEIQKQAIEQTGGKNRGKPAVFSRKIEVNQFGNTPDKMQVRDIVKTPEERICAIFRIHPMVVGLGAGLERSTFNNMREAREAAVESCNVPMWSRIAGAMTQYFGGTENKARLLKDGERIEFDLTKVRALQEDENARWDRLGKAYRNYGGIKRSEFRRALGFTTTPDDDVFITDIDAAKAQDTLMAQEAAKAKSRADLYASLGLE